MLRVPRFAPILLPLVLAACGFSVDFDPGVAGSGRSVTASRDVAAFDRIEIGGEIDADVEVGPARSVTLTGDDNLLELVETEVRGGTLRVKPIEDLEPRAGLTARITVPSLASVSVGGSGDVRVRGVRSPSFEAGVHGSASMRVEGERYGDLRAGVSGSGELAMEGAADAVDGRVSGSGSLDLLGVRARTARVHVSGSGDVVVHATEALDAQVSGSGDVRYAGDPSVGSTVSGSGSVRAFER